MSAAPPAPALRVARPTGDLDRLRSFYCNGLGFEPIGGFHDHDGIDGLTPGHRGWPYHLEFTHHRGHPAPCSTSPLICRIVLYHGDWTA